MSVSERLEILRGKQLGGGVNGGDMTMENTEDKAGWRRLIHGAMTKAAGLFWSTGGTLEVTLGPTQEASEEPVVKFTDMRSPCSDSYCSVSLESTKSDLYLSMEDTAVVSPTPSKVGKVTSPTTLVSGVYTTPKSHSTPYKENQEKKSLMKGNVDGGSHIPSPSDITNLCSELERLSLKKIITQVEKCVATNIKEEFDRKKREFEEHDRQVELLLTRERAEKEVEAKVLEMNWFQRIKESQSVVVQNFTSNIDAIVSKSNRLPVSDRNLKTSVFQKDSSTTVREKLNEEQKSKELEIVARKRIMIEAVGNIQKSYNTKYNELLLLLQSGNLSLFTEFQTELDSLKNNNNLFSDIISKSRNGNIDQSDVDGCTNLLLTLNLIFDKIKKRKDEHTKKIDEENLRLVEESNQNNQINVEITDNVSPPVDQSTVSKYGDSVVSSNCNKRRLERLKYCKYVTGVLSEAEESLKFFVNDNKHKNFRKDCQRAVNVPINAISPTSAQHLRDKLDKLADLLEGRRVLVMNRNFNASTHPQGVKYCSVLLARKIVKAGEDVVSSHPETGHAIASVVACLIIRNPLLAVYLHACFFRVCPYLVPLELSSTPKESNEEYNKRLGFLYEGEEREETDKFLKRMSGVAQLYGALLIAHRRRTDSMSSPPFGISELWLWISNFISLEPLSDISATLLLDMLEVTGHFMLTNYGYNFQKLLYLICTDYLIRIDRVTNKGRGGPVERLKTFLQDVIKVKRIPPPKGLLPPHFW